LPLNIGTVNGAYSKTTLHSLESSYFSMKHRTLSLHISGHLTSWS